MSIPSRQLKINKIFRKGGKITKPIRQRPLQEKENEELELDEEIKQLEEKIREQQNEFFQMLRNRHRIKVLPKRSAKKIEVFVRPEKIVLQNQVESYRNKLDLTAMLTGLEVQSYVAGDHFSIAFHMQHKSETVVKHGLRIEMKGGINDISTSNLPLGFNLNAVLEDYENVKQPQCLLAIRKALYAYYNRLEQYEDLQKLVNIEVELFRILDTSHVEITLRVQNELDEDDEPQQFSITIMLDYRVYDIRPKYFSVRQPDDLPEDMVEAIMSQCSIFKKQPLPKAFKEAFISGDGHYKFVRQLWGDGVRERPRPQNRVRPRPRQDYNNDDTFRPEECSEVEDDDEDIID